MNGLQNFHYFNFQRVELTPDHQTELQHLLAKPTAMHYSWPIRL